MTGIAPMTVSPCSCITTRKTPWVLGCCGPRFRVSRFSSSTTPRESRDSKMVSPSSAPCPGTRPWGERVSTIALRRLVVPAHGKADEIVRQQDAAQVGMAKEADAHHLERLAFHELGTRPDGRDRGDLGHGFARQVGAQDDAHRLSAEI